MAEEASKRGRSAKRKGADGEREISHIFNENGIETRRGDCFRGESDVIGVPGVHIEVKRVEKLNLYLAMAQAIQESARKNDGRPTVFHRRNRGKWLVTMRIEDWMEIYKGWLDGK